MTRPSRTSSPEPAADRRRPEMLLAPSFFTLSGAGFGEPARNGLAERLDAAAEAGFTGIGLQVDDVERRLAAGVSLDDIDGLLRASDLRLVEIEFLSGWAVDADPAQLAQTEQRIYRIAAALGGHHVSAGEFSSDADRFDLGRAAARLAEVSARAAGYGLLVAVEPFPWSPIGDIRTAMRLLETAGAPNAGLLIDVWHFFNCGATLDDLAGVPAHRIAAVQLNDGPRVRENLVWNARNTRWLPGDGELDVTGLIRRIAQLGYDGPYCAEVNYPEFRELSARDAARRTFARVQATLVEAGLR